MFAILYNKFSLKFCALHYFDELEHSQIEAFVCDRMHSIFFVARITIFKLVAKAKICKLKEVVVSSLDVHF